MSTQTSTPHTPVTEQRRMPFGRWMAEIGWRHILGLIAVVFAVFPILFVVSASLNPLGTVSSSGIIPRDFSLVHYKALLSGSRGPFVHWYINTVVVCGVVAVVQVFLSTLAAYAFSRFRFTGRRIGLLSLLLIMMFPAVLAMIAVYSMISGLGDIFPFLGLNSLPGYIVVLLGGSLGQVC